MSHAGGLCKFKNDENIYHCEYDGTSDYMKSRIFETDKEMCEYWREEQPVLLDNCCHELEWVTLYTSYASGFYWEAKVCRKCMSIIERDVPWHWEEIQTGPLSYELDTETSWDRVDGEPNWVTIYYEDRASKFE